jgi:hypothetical protein
MSNVLKNAGLGVLFIAAAAAVRNQESLPTVTVPVHEATCQVILEEPLGVKSAVVINSKGQEEIEFKQGTDVFGPKYTGEGIMGSTWLPMSVGAFSVGVEGGQAKTCTVGGKVYVADNVKTPNSAYVAKGPRI